MDTPYVCKKKNPAEVGLLLLFPAISKTRRGAFSGLQGLDATLRPQSAASEKGKRAAANRRALSLRSIL